MLVMPAPHISTGSNSGYCSDPVPRWELAGGPSTWSPATNTGDTDGVTTSWLHSVPASVIWGLNQRVQDILFLSLSFTPSLFFLLFLHFLFPSVILHLKYMFFKKNSQLLRKIGTVCFHNSFTHSTSTHRHYVKESR